MSLEKATALIGEPVHRTILALDIEGSTGPGRRDVDRLRMRAALYHLLEQCLRRAGVQPADHQRSDQGDGVLVLLSPEVPKTRVLPGLVLRLAAGLDRYNRSAPVASRLRLRAVMHAGEVASDPHGHASKDLNLTFRLLDSNLLRGCLADAPTSLVLLVSDSIYSDIVEQGYGGIDPEAFKPVHVHCKNLRARAWLYLPGRSNAIAPDRLREPTDARPAVPGRTVPHELPPDTPDFTGREAELDELLAAFGRDDAGPPTVAVIHGVGGVGKSALAVHAAHRLAARFPDGQLYVNLQGATVGLWPLDPGEVVGRLLRGLGVDGGDIPVDVEEATARLRSLVADRRILLVLDNAVSAAQVRPLLPASGNSAALITSRCALTTLDSAAHLHLDVLPAEEANRLLGTLAGADRLAAEPRAAAEVARHCGYLPLGLRIAGARLAARPTWPVRALAERLGDERTRLDELELAELAVRSCIQVGYQALTGSDDDRERAAARMFRLLGLHPGSEVGTWTAAALLDAPPAVATAALERLVDAQLLESPAPGRYRLHDLLLLFAREQAVKEERDAERDAALRRMLDCYLATALRANHLLQPGALEDNGPLVVARTVPLADRAEAFAWFERERASLLAAARRAACGSGSMPAFTVRLSVAMFWFFEMRTYWRDFKEINELAVSAARQRQDRHGEAVGLTNLGISQTGLRRFEDAIRYCGQASVIFRELGDRLWEGAALGGLGSAYREHGQPDRAVEFLERSLACFRDLAAPFQEGMALRRLGLAYCDKGRFEDAVDCLQQSLALCREVQDLHGEAITRGNLGEVHYHAGFHHGAIECYEESLRIHREIGDRRRVAEMLWRLGYAQHALGRHQRARACWREARGIFREVGVPFPQRRELGRPSWS